MVVKKEEQFPDLVLRYPAIKLIGRKRGGNPDASLVVYTVREREREERERGAGSLLPVCEVALTQTGNPFTASVCALGLTYLFSLCIAGLEAIIVVFERARTTRGSTQILY